MARALVVAATFVSGLSLAGATGASPDAQPSPATLLARHVVVATGSLPRALPGADFDETLILSNTGALALPEVPKRLGIVGAGVVGLELGSVWRRLGSQVTILEALPTFLGAADEQIAGPHIGRFQVLRHRLAEMATQLEVSREFTYRQAAKMAAGKSVVKEISMAKNFATDVSDRIVYDATQILGGMGFMRESRVERLYRDNRILSIGGILAFIGAYYLFRQNEEDLSALQRVVA